MKLDTSSYYPEPLLPPEGEDEKREESLIPSGSPAVTSAVDAAAESRGEDPGRSSKEPTSGGFLDYLATLLSWGLVPLLMPVYGMLLMFDLTALSYAPSSSKMIFTGVVFIINVVIPFLLILLLKKLGLVDDYGLNGRRERLIPYLITLLCMGGTAWYMAVKGSPMFTCMFFAGGGMAAFVNLLVNFRWKISAHAAGVAGVIALLIHIAHIGFRPDTAVLAWLVIWTLLAGLLGSSRIWLGRHTLGQVLCGLAVGFCSVFFPITFIH